jgi:hypothetical protein
LHAVASRQANQASAYNDAGTSAARPASLACPCRQVLVHPGLAGTWPRPERVAQSEPYSAAATIRTRVKVDTWRVSPYVGKNKQYEEQKTGLDVNHALNQRGVISAGDENHVEQ